MSDLFAFALIIAAAASSATGAQETFILKPGAEAVIGSPGGDALRLEGVTGDEAVVLVRPGAQDCAFRIQLRIGQSVPMRSGSYMHCQAELRSVAAGSEASFAITCSGQASQLATELKCPAAQTPERRP